MNALVLGNVGYEHCGATVLISPSPDQPPIWIENESDSPCPVKCEGWRAADVAFEARQHCGRRHQQDQEHCKISDLKTLRNLVDGVTGRIKAVESLFEMAEIVGIDRKAAEREVLMLLSLADGSGLKHYLERDYFLALSRTTVTDVV